MVHYLLFNVNRATSPFCSRQTYAYCHLAAVKRINASGIRGRWNLVSVMEWYVFCGNLASVKKFLSRMPVNIGVFKMTYY